ncbi:MAG: DNA-3-methyladenine glycosylase [Pseudomonadota bacterium]
MSAFECGFYARDAKSVARDLLGSVLVHRHAGVERRARIVETEAYVGVHDRASHAARGRTPRTEVMFGSPGHAYIYLVYGMHELFNVVTGAAGDAQAVLIRAAEPLAHCTGPLNGPGRLTRALGIDRSLNCEDLTGGRLFLEPGPPPARMVTTTRIGVDYAGPWKDAPLRFYDADSRAVSKR